MTNRDAIELLEEVRMLDDTMYAYNPNYMEAIDMALNALEAEETWYATHEYPPKTRWIPCSERLPDKEGRYLCTVGALFHNPRVMTYAPDTFLKGDCDTWRAEDGTYCFNWFVEAWMPLPEPWEGEKYGKTKL